MLFLMCLATFQKELGILKTLPTVFMAEFHTLPANLTGYHSVFLKKFQIFHIVNQKTI